jgi:hypothetical protein
MTRAIPFVVIALASTAFAQTSELWLTSYQSTNTYVVRNGQIVRQFSRTATNDGPGIVVQGTTKMFGQGPSAVGREYDNNGNLLTGQYVNPGFTDCYDGATDGTHNWSIAHNDFATNFAVVVGDADWGSVQVAWVPARRSSGITYDSTDGTLWITNVFGGADRVQHFTTAGALLGEFPVNLTSGGGYSMALDPADQTLWLPGAFGSQGQLFQYSKTGTLLQTVTVSGLMDNIMGSEFRFGGGTVTYCTAGTTTHGCVPSIGGTGTPSASASSGFTIAVGSVEGQKIGMIFYGINNTGFTPVAWGPSTSFLCVKSPTQRMGQQVSGGTINMCDGALSIDWNAFRAANPGALGSPFVAGQQVFAQGWFRDPPSPKTTMLSDALRFTLGP